MSISSTYRRFSLLLLLVAALLLRLQNWHPFQVVDEDTILTMVWGLHLDPLPPGMPLPLPGYPPLFIYLNFLLSLLYREILVFLGVFSSAAEFLASPAARNFTLKAGQFLVALMGTFHVAVIWKIGKDFFDRRVAWLAAVLVAFHPHLVLNGHIFKSDVPLALLFSLILLFSLRFLKTLGNKEFFITSFLAGMAVACKYNGAVEVLILPFILWISRKDLLPGRWRKLLLLSPVFGLLGFLVFAPNWAVHPVASFTAAYRYAVFHFQEFSFYEQVSSTYGRYVTDLWQTIGPIFLFLFFVGMIFAVLHRKKDEMAILISILLYFIVQGRSVFFGSRIILPILGAVALIAASGAFRHLYFLFKKLAWQRAFSIAIFSGVLFFALSNIGKSISLYNLWKTSSTFEEAVSFRKDHIPEIFPFGREGFTPRNAGDRGQWDIFSIPDPGLFQGNRALPFLSTGILTDHLLNISANKNLRGKLRRRLQNYRVFHKITKPRFGPWDGDIIFWYRPHPRLLAINPDRKKVSLPRLFRSEGGDTLFFPLQLYEKDPGFLPLQGNFIGKWILSSKPMGTLSITIFCPIGEITAKVKLNNREILLSACKGIAEIRLPAPPSLALQRSPLYRLEVRLPENHPPAFLLIKELPSIPARVALILSSPLEDDPPELFTAETPSAWVREFYRKTGIDLSLLALTQEVVLWENSQRSLVTFTSEWMAFPRGIYRCEMEVEPLSAEVRGGDPPPLLLELFSGGHFETRTLVWEKNGDGRFAVSLENRDERILLRIKSGDLRRQNLLLLRLCLRPDYLKSIRRGLVFLNSSEPGDRTAMAEKR